MLHENTTKASEYIIDGVNLPLYLKEHVMITCFGVEIQFRIFLNLGH
jgi:hypothetical protein